MMPAIQDEQEESQESQNRSPEHSGDGSRYYESFGDLSDYDDEMDAGAGQGPGNPADGANGQQAANEDDPDVGRFTYKLAPKPEEFDFFKATDELENILYPHHLLTILLQGPCKTQLKLSLIDQRIDEMLSRMCFYLRKPIQAVARQQK